MLSLAVVMAQAPAHATARTEVTVTGITVTHVMTDGSSNTTLLSDGFTHVSEGTNPSFGLGPHFLHGPNLLPGESATFSIDVILSVFDQGLSGAPAAPHWLINPPIFTSVGVIDELIPSGFESALASVGIGMAFDCRNGTTFFTCNGLSVLQTGFHEIKTNKDDVADSASFSGTVSGAVRNPAGVPNPQTWPAVMFFVESFYQQSSPMPEPETYAMLLAGLGLMGFVARRNNLRAV